MIALVTKIEKLRIQCFYVFGMWNSNMYISVRFGMGPLKLILGLYL